MSAATDRRQQPPPTEVELPGPRTRTVLLFEFLVLIEYWLAPLFFGVDNYVGLWSWVGYALFAALVLTLSVGVLVPLRGRLRPTLAVRRHRWLFHGLWASSVVAGLFATATFRFADASTFTGGPGLALDWEPVSTPFGSWPTLLFSFPPFHLDGALNVEVLSLLGVLSVLWASVVVLGLALPTGRCVSPPAAAPPRTRAAAVLVWGPLGFMTGCSSCTPLYVALLGLVAPGAGLGVYNSIPLVPWIGLAGLLYVASLALTLHLLRRATDRRVTPGPEIAGSISLTEATG